MSTYMPIYTYSFLELDSASKQSEVRLDKEEKRWEQCHGKVCLAEQGHLFAVSFCSIVLGWNSVSAATREEQMGK